MGAGGANVERDSGRAGTGFGREEYFGDTFSIADIALGVVVPIAFLCGMSVRPYPRPSRWIRRLAARKSFQQTSSFMNHLEVATS